MADNNKNNRRNVTGSYPGVTGSYRSHKSDVNERSKTVRESEKKPQPPKKEGFDFKLWFSKDNVKGFLKQLRFYGIILITSLLLTWGIVSVANDIFAFIKPEESVIVTIPQGESVSGIAKTLKSSNVIKHPLVFRLYSKLKKADGKYQYGDYALNSNLSYDQIISKLKKASVQAQTVTVKIEPGDTQDDFVEYLTSNKYVSATELENALNSYKYEEFEFLGDLPDRRCRLEGYLFPGEYEIAIGESAVSIISKVLTRFKESVLTEANVQALNVSGLTLDEVVTLASVIYKECDKEDMYKGAAAVIKNRLATPESAFLNLTSPIRYVLPSYKAVLNADDKRTASPYNTYLYSGLPTGPITSPSLTAIESVLYPETSAYMYFISDGEKSYFATTLDEHNKNLEKCSETCKGTDVIK